MCIPRRSQSSVTAIFHVPANAALLEQIGQVWRKFRTHPNAGLRVLRRIFLTEAGEYTDPFYTDPFTLQGIAGHDNIKTTMRYERSREAAVHKLFVRLADLQRPEDRVECKKSVRKIRCSWKCPHKMNSVGYGL